MYAIVEVSGKQYKVAPDDVIEVNQIESNDRNKIALDKVLLISDGSKVDIGQPYVEGASVDAEIVEQVKAAKVIIFKYLRRKDSHKKTGHRQKLTKLLIKKINK
ncbi:MAG: 50S ribosomal protein L21 [Candidatus Omnitrophica bacterium]|nr:50S ribosomal protein L21 [Candidatus Omnitrophota bacterium]MBU4479629.1 50S ribosomal protein L21 [Candidatus Omnitrophota bacterium]MCG2703701.1 50S ribosomal protein L21 [Candidatus Omnitrophota bacterium]